MFTVENFNCGGKEGAGQTAETAKPIFKALPEIQVGADLTSCGRIYQRMETFIPGLLFSVLPKEKQGKIALL